MDFFNAPLCNDTTNNEQRISHEYHHPTTKLKVNEMIQFINSLILSPPYIYKMFCNSFTDKNYALNGVGVGMYLYDMVFENVNVYCTHTHLMLNQKLKFLICELRSKDKHTVCLLKNKAFSNIVTNDITKRITYTEFKYNKRIIIDKLVLIFWFVYFLFKCMHNGYFRIKLILIDALLYLETTVLKLEKIQKNKKCYTPVPFRDCLTISELRRYISNPKLYKQLYRYIKNG